MVSLVTSVTSMLVSILTHIRYSKCGFCEIETREDTERSIDENKNRSRSNSNHSHNEQQPLIQPLN
jgi:hypothetical protein